ncbi:DUF6817 domain-containing protein [Chitinibacter sp. FCG-7]|uniref:DUF6817 domain-containing protein n=1 Tax=Chitinibacter mangrovi TaxID=3153927 RepID=A0AAU7F8I1_9NEIS
MTSAQDLFAELNKLGAGEFVHLNGSLENHLLGTEQLLRRWGAEDKVCRAGLFHAAYGSAGYEDKLISINLRDQITKLIGAEAESLVYLYCACDRNLFYPRIGTSTQYLFSNRFNGAEHNLSHEELCALCEITLANELELALSSDEFWTKYKAELCDLFNRMQELVSEAGFHAFKLRSGTL